MGIKKLGPFLRKSKLCKIERTLAHYHNTTVAIDVPIYMYKFRNAHGESYLDSFQRMYHELRHQGITPVYVFDGRPPQTKTPELLRRREVKQQMKATAENVQLPFCQRVAARAKYDALPQKRHYEALQAWLTASNIEWSIAPADAEKTCSHMTMTGKADVVMSEDFDCLVYGATRLLTGYTLQQRTRKMIEYDLRSILDRLQWSQQEWVDFCILCGCDLCPKIKNIGPAKAKVLITAHSDMEHVLQFLDRTKFGVPEDFCFQAARDEFRPL